MFIKCVFFFNLESHCWGKWYKSVNYWEYWHISDNRARFDEKVELPVRRGKTMLIYVRITLWGQFKESRYEDSSQKQLFT